MTHATDIECELVFDPKQPHTAHIYVTSDQGLCCDACVFAALAYYVSECELKRATNNADERLH